jgi:hypothetical protein
MPRNKNHHPRFLSVAYAQEKLTARQIAEIVAEQGRLRQAGIHLKVGPIAETLGYLSPQDAAKIEEQRAALAGQEMTDALGQPHSDVRKLSPQVRNRLLFCGTLLSLVVLGAVFMMTRSWADLGTAASILGLVWVTVPNLLLGPRLTFSGWLRWLSGPLAMLISVLLYRELPDTVSLPWWWYIALITLPLLVGLEAAAGFWRNFKLDTSDLRSCLMRCLTKSFRDSYMEVDKGGLPLSSAITDVLGWTAHIMYLNPWNRLLRKFVPDSFAHPGVTSLWLFRPELTGSDLAFTAIDYKVVGPLQVRDVFARFREKYRPRIDVKKLSEEQASLRKGGFIPDKAFLDEPHLRFKRSEFVSLPGHVFVTQRGVDGGDILGFWGFDEQHYREIIDAETGNNRIARRGARWRAFAAYPIYAGGPQRCQPPSGVLVAFSSTRNGFTSRDRNALVSAARLLGVLLSHERAADLAAVGGVDDAPIQHNVTTN